jgi:response regulator RpfG family c-di-GMP phosphodiesterase
MATSGEDDLKFGDEHEDDARQRGLRPWKILIADDEHAVHDVTRLALSDSIIHGRRLHFLHAYSGSEAVDIMRGDPDIALVLMDVVMEDDAAGLDAVETIRDELGNKAVRIVLRTGQPGQAPEHDVVTRYDINDYKEKTELTLTKLYTVVHTSIGHYRELTAMAKNKHGLEKVISASSRIFELKSLQQFARGVLEQLAALLYAGRDSALVRVEGLAATRHDGHGLLLLAGTGHFADCEGRQLGEVASPQVLACIDTALRDRRIVFADSTFVGYFGTTVDVEHVLFLQSESPFGETDLQLIELFCHNVAIAFDNLALHQDTLDAQSDVIMMLTQTIEERSLETRFHTRRVAEYSRLLGGLCGMSERELELLPVAAALHDVGKIAIADSILQKPGLLSDTEREQMQAHADRGRRLLHGQRRPALQAAAVVASQHHEHWDGHGYPQGLQREAIHPYARIVGLADVFDALCSRRCYKEPWPLAKVMEYIQAQRGRQFDPALVDLFVANLDDFLEIRERFDESAIDPARPDPPPREAVAAQSAH